MRTSIVRVAGLATGALALTALVIASGWYLAGVSQAQSSSPPEVLYLSSAPNLPAEDLSGLSVSIVASPEGASARFVDGVTFAVILDKDQLTAANQALLREWYSRGIVVVAMGVTAGDLGAWLSLSPDAPKSTDADLAANLQMAPASVGDDIRGAYIYSSSNNGCSLSGFGHIATWGSPIAVRLDALRGVHKGLVRSGPDGQLVPACK